MLNINFKLDKDILARTIIAHSCMEKDYANYLWDKYRPSYISIKNKFNTSKIDKNILLEVQQQPFFKALYEESNKNLKRIRTAFNKNKQLINNFLTNIIRCDFELAVTAYIVAPEVKFGSNLTTDNSTKGTDEFVWGHVKGLVDVNYDLTYLVHEALHSYFEMDDLNHAIIENIADIELARALNKTKEFYEGHEFLKNTHVKIFPFWNLYLNKTKEEITFEQEKFAICYDISKFEKFRTRISKMNINEFIKFLEKHVNNVSFKTQYIIN